MLTVYKNVRGTIRKGGLDDIHPAHPLLWIDAMAPTEQEIGLLEKKTSISRKHFLDINDTEEMPRANSFENVAKITLKSSLAADTGGKTAILLILFNKDYVITASSHPLPALQRLAGSLLRQHETKEFIESSDLFVYEVIDIVLEEFNATLDRLGDEIDDVETELLKNPTQKTVQNIFRIKKALIYFHKSLSSNREVIAAIEQGQLPQVSRRNLSWFREVHYDINQLLDVEATYRDIVTGALDLYVSSISNSLNETMKKLTVIATLILVPTIVSGIYGMNFRHMPELDWAFGYPFALGLMLAAIIIAYLYFKKKDWV